ncbi:MAG: UDP-N-acetylmuramoyl-L-alanine--D-glutamate ligase [Arcobacteraceae bacterium]
MNKKQKIRVLGKGITAQAIKNSFNDVILYDENDFNQYDKESEDITIVSPGIPPSNFMVKESNNIQSDYDLIASTMPYSIWISGTNGKTTTTQMVQLLLEKRGSLCGGNIGIPITSLDIKANLWILETSSFTLHYTQKAKPNLYILLPITDDHISWHGNFSEYEKAKLKAMDNMQEGEVAIIPSKYKEYPTSAFKIIYESCDDLLKYFEIDSAKLKFKAPFLMDACMALAISKILFDEIDYEKMNTFVVDAHKAEEFKDKKNRVWVDDSKATNLDATQEALKAYEKQKIYLIVGGEDKGANLEPLFDFFKHLNIKLFAIGKNYLTLLTLAKEFNIEIERCDYLEIAVQKIDLLHNEKSIAILSPAAASLDQFASYKHRGEEFKKCVYSLS